MKTIDAEKFWKGMNKLRILDTEADLKKAKNLFEKHKKIIFSLLSDVDKNLKIKLVGSQAVPMIGKAEIDLLIMTNADILTMQKCLEKKGYGRGPIEKEGSKKEKVGYMRKTDDGIIIELHILSPNHENVKKMKKLVNFFRNNAKKREKLEELKISFKGKPEDEYREAKINFFKNNNLL
jgi:GrpB-like predicted nucleotidyltransferase (UPF0157 family)